MCTYTSDIGSIRYEEKYTFKIQDRQKKYCNYGSNHLCKYKMDRTDIKICHIKTLRITLINKDFEEVKND